MNPSLRWIAALSLVVLPVSAEALVFTITNTNTSGAGSLAKAITDANASSNNDVINFSIPGDGPHVIGGTLPPIVNPVTIDGYTEPGSSLNTRSDGTTDAVLQIELDASAVAPGGAMLRVDNGNVTIRGLAISNIPAGASGIEISEGAPGTQTIRGNFLGTDVTGTVGGGDGIGLLVRDTATIGGAAAADRNLVSGSAEAGIDLRGPSSTVVNNLVGVDADGFPLGNGTGIRISTAAATGNVIGGTAAGAGNVIANNAGEGVRVAASATGNNRIVGNRIFANGGLGIDLGGDGVTPNDAEDADSGPNGLQNHPVLTFARLNGTALSVEGYLVSPEGEYRLEFYRNDELDPTEFGEGQTLLSSVTLTVQAGQKIAFFRAKLTLGSVPASPFFVTATAERVSTAATSEFSRGIDFVFGGAELTVTNANPAGGGSLLDIVGQANANPDVNTIIFKIPVPVQAIDPVGGYVLTAPVIIDGYTQKEFTISTPNSLSVGTNAVIDVEIDGSAVPADTPAFEVQAPGCILRGLSIRSFTGEAIRGTAAADGLRVEGCFLTANGGSGVLTGTAEGVVVGGPITSQRNVLSLNGMAGVDDLGDGTLIANNIIGGDATGGGSLGNAAAGVFLAGDGATVGGDDPRFANVIRDNGGGGIAVAVGEGNLILGNSISDNVGLGIDLDSGDSPGVTPNDVDDVDGGANDRQNFPEVAFAGTVAQTLQVTGSLDVPDATEDATYTIRVFRNTSCDSSGHGEGAVFLGAADVVLSGDAEGFVAEIAADVPEGAILAATATDVALGNTSEFSECFAAEEQAAVCGDPTLDGDIKTADALITLKVAVGTGTCELCRCDANGSGTINTTDALVVLKAAVGQSVALDCPDCA